MFLVCYSVVMLLSAAEQALMAAKMRYTVGQDCFHGLLSSCSCMGGSGMFTPSLAISGSAAVGWMRGKDSVGHSQPGCAVVEGAEPALLYSALPLWLGLARYCRIPCVGADPPSQILISVRDLALGSCLGLALCFLVCQKNLLLRSDE